MFLAPFVQRIEAETSVFKDIKGAAELAAAEAECRRDSCFVLYADDEAGENELLAGVRQRRTIGMGVIMAITNHRDRRGAQALSELEVARGQVIQALLGWEPDGSDGMVTYRRGRLLNFNRATIWWQDEFVVPTLLSAL